jgi:YidC/Oxa1 family membrane protein insertase
MFIDANIFQPLIDVFEAVLKFFHNSGGIGWGWSIVLLTVAVRLLLLPLTLKQFHSMQRLQRLQPQMKAIQQKYKEDKQRQQQEIMKFYKENHVNPFGSCAPLALQLPVFISLFYMLRSSLRHDICPHLNPLHAAHTVPCGPHGGAGFLFIPDLTNNAHGAVLVALIILYVGTQLASTLMMSAPGMDQNQRRLMMFMPLFFVIFVINFPAGVLVYWITTNAWTWGQQWFVRRRLGPVTPAVAADAPAPTDRTTGGRKTPPQDGSPPENGGGMAGLSGMIKSRLKPADETSKEPAGVATRSRERREGPPPPPPRKKKKRSGRRR